MPAPRILVVDDEPDVELLLRQQFRKELRQQEYHFLFAHHGAEALDVLGQHRDVDLVLTDINMPTMDGLTLLSRLAELHPELQAVVVVSAYGDMGNIRTAMNRGAFDFLIKPIDMNDFRITLTRSLRHLAALQEARRERERLLAARTQLAQFFSPELILALERDPELLDGRSQEVTILVSDLRGFTRLSEQHGPQVSCRIVRDIMERLTEQIFAQQGVVVDYAGDGILAMWNAPLPQEDHAARACRAALAMLAELPELNSRWRETVGSPLAIGIGINTGTVHVGNTGSSRNLKYGPHGLTVNLASRVQGATKKLGRPALITAATRKRLPADLKTLPVAKARLRGISERVPLFELCMPAPRHLGAPGAFASGQASTPSSGS